MKMTGSRWMSPQIEIMCRYPHLVIWIIQTTFHQIQIFKSTHQSWIKNNYRTCILNVLMVLVSSKILNIVFISKTVSLNVCFRLFLSGEHKCVCRTFPVWGTQYMFTLCNVCTVIGDGRGQCWDGRGLQAPNGAFLYVFLSCKAGFATSVTLRG